jgi:hypothetical protein
MPKSIKGSERPFLNDIWKGCHTRKAPRTLGLKYSNKLVQAMMMQGYIFARFLEVEAAAEQVCTAARWGSMKSSWERA